MLRYRLRTLLATLLAWRPWGQGRQPISGPEISEARFTDRVRKVLVLANNESLRLNHEYIGPEHLLLGVLREGSGVAATALRNVSGDPGRIEKEMERLIIRGPAVTSSSLSGMRPMTPRAKRIIENAKEEARMLNHNFIGTEHVLLGLMREHESLPVTLLLSLGIDGAMVRHEVRSILGIT